MIQSICYCRGGGGRDIMDSLVNKHESKIMTRQVQFSSFGAIFQQLALDLCIRSLQN